METKVCKCCGRELDLSHFKRGRFGYTSVCLDCDTQHRRENKMKRIAEQKQKVEDVRTENRQLCLNDFSPRELMEELARRGYKGKLQYVRVEEIDICNF